MTGDEIYELLKPFISKNFIKPEVTPAYFKKLWITKNSIN